MEKKHRSQQVFGDYELLNFFTEDVSESLLQEIDRYYELQEGVCKRRDGCWHDSRFTVREKGTDIVFIRCIVEPPGIHEGDPGFITFYDARRERNIFVSTWQLAHSAKFHEQMQVNGLFDVIKPNTIHQYFVNMTALNQKWLLMNMRYVSLQIYKTDGNIILSCKNGRSRSPMYLVVYIIVVYDVTIAEAMKIVSTILFDVRNVELDRYELYVPALRYIIDRKCMHIFE